MTPKEFLQKGRKMSLEIDELIRERDRAFALACGTAVKYDDERVQTSPGNVTEAKFINYAEATRLIDQKIDDLYAYRLKMHRVIDMVDNSLYRAVLIARYINCDTWECIAERFNYDLRWIYRLHGKALKEILYKEFTSIINE